MPANPMQTVQHGAGLFNRPIRLKTLLLIGGGAYLVWYVWRRSQEQKVRTSIQQGFTANEIGKVRAIQYKLHDYLAQMYPEATDDQIEVDVRAITNV